MRLGPEARPLCAADRPLVPRGAARRGVQVWACPLQNQTAPSCPTPCAKAGKLVSVNVRGTRYSLSLHVRDVGLAGCPDEDIWRYGTERLRPRNERR